MKHIFFFIIIVLLYFSQPRLLEAAKSGPLGVKVTVSASLGTYRFTLYGYTSPFALVTLEGIGLYYKTYANDTGYFEFKNQFSPLVSEETCLTAKDQLGRVTPLLCLPPFPVNTNTTIGPVIMPPTISLDQSNYFVDDTVVVSGQTTSDTDVDISLFTDEGKTLAFVQPVEAFSFPKLQVRSDKQGNFSVSLPSSYAKTYRLFAQAEVLSEKSPHSLILTLKIFPLWMIIVKLFMTIIILARQRLLELLFIIQLIGMTLYLVNHHLHPHRMVKTKALAIKKEAFLAKIKQRD